MAVLPNLHYLAGKEMSTSSDYFKYKWEIYLASKTTKETVYYIYTFLKWVGGSGGTPSYVTKNTCPVRNPNSGESENCINFNPTTYISGTETLARMRHDWHITYVLDGKSNTVYFDTFDTWLPDDNAKKGVVNTGHLHMKKNVWYQWGPPRTGKWANNGKTHTVKVTMHMDEFGYPWNCPSADAPASTAQKTITMPQYAITPGKSKVTVNGPWYNYNVTWTTAQNAKEYLLRCRINGGDWTNVHKAWQTNTFKFTPSTCFRYVPGTTIEYCVLTRSSTGNIVASDFTPKFVVGGGVKIKVAGSWRSGTVYIKVNGKWVKANYVATKQSGAWKISKY
jgi:hypothetical protein